MIYLKVAHSEDNDCDLFKFNTIVAAIAYLEKWQVTDWIMSDIQFEEYDTDEYEYVN